MEKILNAILDLKVENLNFEHKFDEKINAVFERLNKIETKLNEQK
jgi:hypothetical protein